MTRKTRIGGFVSILCVKNAVILVAVLNIVVSLISPEFFS